MAPFKTEWSSVGMAKSTEHMRKGANNSENKTKPSYLTLTRGKHTQHIV